jgi:hypothetical protein
MFSESDVTHTVDNVIDWLSGFSVWGGESPLGQMDYSKSGGGAALPFQ